MFYNDFDNPDNNSIIDLEKYKKICKACDEILLSPESNEVTVAIPILHVIREHPVFLKQYEKLFSIIHTSSKNSNFFLKIKSIIRYFFDLILNTFSKNKYWNSSHPIEDNYDYILVSHFLNISQAGKKNDFYFDEVPTFLRKNGIKVLVVLINHTNYSSNFITKKWALKNDVPRIILKKNTGFLNELIYYLRFKKESNRLKKISRKEKEQIKKQIFEIASDQFIPTINNIRLSKHFFKLFKKTNPKRVITTHEGHAWERLLFASARKVNPNIYCIGYQHALIFKEQHAIKRNLKKIYNPNLILASGIIGKFILEQSTNLKDVDCYLFGSNRYFEINNKTIKLEKNNTILVIPEAIYSECILLFEFSIKCANLMPEINFIWRLHPLMTFDQIISANIDINNLPINIILSTSAIEEDISNSKYVLYRGSTAVVTSVLYGLQPIYLSKIGEMTIDPLYFINYYKLNVNSPNQLLNIFYDENKINKQENVEKNKFIFEIKKMFHPLDLNYFLRS